MELQHASNDTSIHAHGTTYEQRPAGHNGQRDSKTAAAHLAQYDEVITIRSRRVLGGTAL